MINKMKLSHFDFDLPNDLLADRPSENRDESRLMVVDKKSGKIEHKLFKDLIDLIIPSCLTIPVNITLQHIYPKYH